MDKPRNARLQMENLCWYLATSWKGMGWRAGLGWIGKNSNLINKHHGSWFTLGFWSHTDLVPDKPHQSLCGKCDMYWNCPTKAIVEPFVQNSVAYHTIESREKLFQKNKRKFKWMGCRVWYLPRRMSLE